VTTFYLQRIEISNFRAYGDNFSLSLPGPGVTILAGPQGLGKSAFFESIEWALTGRVRRLEALTQEGLDRGRSNGLLARREQDGPVAQYRVSLEFVNGEGACSRIERRAVREQENRERFAELSSPTQQQVIDLLRADSWLSEISDIGEYLRLTHLRRPSGTAKIDLAAAEEALNAWQQLNSVLAEARVRHAASRAALVGLQDQLRAALEVDERRRGAESKRDTLLRLSAARQTISQGAAQKTSIVSRIDRHTHELWMVQTYLRDATKTLKKVADLDSRIQSLLLAKQEIERCQKAYDEWVKEETVQASRQASRDAIQSSPMLTGVAWEQIPSHLAESSLRTQSELETAQAAREQLPGLEGLDDRRAELKARIDELSLEIKREHGIVAQLEQELLAAQALQQQYPELLSELGTLPSDEDHAIDEAVRAVEQLVHHERQLVHSEEPFPSALSKLNAEIIKAQTALEQRASEVQNIEQQFASLRQRWLELGLQGFPGPVALDEQRNTLAEQESKLQGLREQQKRMADAWLAWQSEVDAVAWLSSMSTAYQWSRWPALLLDDPLQPHDLIHTEAFIEALRNLARDRSYQVILSTHDEALADGIRRKMVEAGIPCAICQFRGLGPTGVLYSTG
jgi:hypothetical protein